MRQGIRRLKICSDLTYYIEKIAKNSVPRAAQDNGERIEDVRKKNFRTLNEKKFLSKMSRKRI